MDAGFGADTIVKQRRTDERKNQRNTSVTGTKGWDEEKQNDGKLQTGGTCGLNSPAIVLKDFSANRQT